MPYFISVLFMNRGGGVGYHTLWSDTNQGARIRTEQIIDLK